MARQRPKRRLAAILAADVVGYSRLMRADEAGTHAELKALRAELFEPKIAEYGGRIVKTTGDGTLIEFPSAVDAVQSAVDVQRLLRDHRLELRIGINLGDVIVDDEEIYGDGVNVAARIEGLAEPGGISVSGSVHEQVKDKLDLRFDDTGPQEVKNIDEPVRVYRISLDGEAAPPPLDDAPPLPDKPSIAVLPFENMSGDPEQEYFADGMVEEIITALSRLSWLFVIARNSSFIYKGRAVDIRQVARELGVRYVLEGSVRKAGKRVRLTGQLINATTGGHIWADRFDGEIEDIFDLQGRITESVVGAIEPRLRKAEIERSRRKRPDSLDAYDLYLRSLPKLYTMSPDDNAEALDLLERALALDDQFAPALAGAAWCREQRFFRRWPTARDDDLEIALALSRAALAVDSEDANSIALAAFVLAVVGRDLDAGWAAAARALELNPNTASVCWGAGWVLVLMGDHAEAIAVFKRALRLSPSDPLGHFMLNGIGLAQLLQGRHAEALETANRSAALNTELDVTYWVMAPALGYLGRTEEAGRAISKLRSLAPAASISHFRQRLPFRDENDLEVVLEGFRRAGLTEA